jgi:fermentation-respiration switch protein FrsA (DUF1100 family)
MKGFTGLLKHATSISWDSRKINIRSSFLVPDDGLSLEVYRLRLVAITNPSVGMQEQKFGTTFERRHLKNAGILTSIFFFLVLLSQVGCSGLLFHPTKINYVQPETLAIVPSDLWIEVEQGIKLHAWYFEAKKAISKRSMIVQFHGNAENLSSHFYSLAWIVDYGFDLLIFDYRGYGRSTPKSPTPEAAINDGIEVIQFSFENFPSKKIFIYGQSLGAAIAARSVINGSYQNKISGLILEGSFSSYQAVAKSILARSAWTWVLQPLAYLTLSDKFSPDGKWTILNQTPILVIHGALDPVIPLKFGEDVFAKIESSDKTFLKVKDGKHIDLYLPSRIDERLAIVRWLKKRI